MRWRILPATETEAFGLVADEGNLPDLVAGMDVALDCLDNISAKTALEQAASLLACPLFTVPYCATKAFATPTQPAGAA